MGRERQVDKGNLYGRVLQRLTVALEEAERTAGDSDSASVTTELEVGGLTPAEFDLIRAYLQQDAQWLSGWHAAAEEQAQLVRQATRPALRNVLRHHPSKRGRQAPLSVQQTMNCALCGASVTWPEGAGPVACSACGSQLLRARQRLHTYPKH